MPLPRRRPDLPVGAEEPVPYDRTGLMGEEGLPPAPPPGGPPGPPAGPPTAPPMDLGGMGQPAPMDLGAMAPDMADPMAAGLGDQMSPEAMSPEDAQVEQMAAALDDPNIDPATRAQIEQQLQLAARRQLAGMGG